MKILVAGDFCPQNRVAELVENGDYSFLDDVKETIKRVDYSVVNFECPVTYGDEKPNLERLSLHCSENGMDAISYAGFNCVTLANNHFRDWGDGGVSSTLNACKKYGIDYVGGGDNLVHRYGEIIEDKTFIYYLIDLTNITRFKRETRARLQAITKVIRERDYESGLKLVGTHYEDFQKATGLSKEGAKERMVKCIGLKEIKDVKVDDVILIAELTDKNDINQILEQIIA